MDEFAQTLLETHTAAELAEQLSYRIDEMRDLREALEAEREKKAPKTLLARIAELERDLAKVNERLAAAQNLPPTFHAIDSQTPACDHVWSPAQLVFNSEPCRICRLCKTVDLNSPSRRTP